MSPTSFPFERGAGAGALPKDGNELRAGRRPFVTTMTDLGVYKAPVIYFVASVLYCTILVFRPTL